MELNQEYIHKLIDSQRIYFNTNETLDISFRVKQIKKLRKVIIENESLILEALHKDLGRCDVEGHLLDVGPLLLEIDEVLDNIKKWAKSETHFSGLHCFPSIFTKVYKMPFGVTLIISPFNFPFLLSLGPALYSMSAGNTCIIKCSSKSKYSTNVMMKIINENFDAKYLHVLDGGHDIADLLLEERFDKIFYTGSPNVAKHVLEKASKNLTPVALELGGENGNWAIIRKDADLDDAARKIAFFKIINAGQVCININQVAIERSVASLFLDKLKKEIIRQIGENPENNDEFDCLISDKAVQGAINLINDYKEKIYYGGTYSIDKRKVSPTILYPIEIDDKIVQHELFNSLLPVVVYDDDEIDKLLDIISNREHGLALYIFTKNKRWANKVMSTQQFGGGCINEVCLHLMVKGVPFNGVGHSGMGAYHGIYGFNEFSHPQTVLQGSTKFNLSLREHPYGKKKRNLIDKLLK